MNVGLQYPARGEDSKRKGKRKRGHVDLFSSVRNVRFGILVGWFSARIDFVPFYNFPRFPPTGCGDLFSNIGTEHHQRLRFEALLVRSRHNLPVSLMRVVQRQTRNGKRI